MYDVFGNFDSVEEMNACAAGLLQEGDIDNIKLLAKENGIQEIMVDLYLESGEEFVTPMDAAIGKLEVECAEYKDKRYPVEETGDYLKSLCIEEQFARRVRRRTKSMKECMKVIKEKCMEVQKKTGKYHVPDMTVFRWARDYFLED